MLNFAIQLCLGICRQVFHFQNLHGCRNLWIMNSTGQAPCILQVQLDLHSTCIRGSLEAMKASPTECLLRLWKANNLNVHSWMHIQLSICTYKVLCGLMSKLKLTFIKFSREAEFLVNFIWISLSWRYTYSQFRTAICILFHLMIDWQSAKPSRAQNQFFDSCQGIPHCFAGLTSSVAL